MTKQHTMKLFLVLISIFTSFVAGAQKLTTISLASDGSLKHFLFQLPEDVVVQIGRDGQLQSWGVDVLLPYNDPFRSRLEPYTGRVAYYGPNVDSAFRGKIRSIGQVVFTWYASYEYESLKGKLKSIGNLPIDYYLDYENEAYRGAVKMIGPDRVMWYASFDNEALRGKLSMYASIPLTYYSSFDDPLIKGKVKAIGRNSFTYYGTYDRSEYRGGYKTGGPYVTVDRIRFTIGL